MPLSLAPLGIEPAADAKDADWRLDRGGFAYLPQDALSPQLAELSPQLAELCPLLGLRAPMHTAAHELHPFAPVPNPGYFPPDLSRAPSGDPAPAQTAARPDLQGRRQRGAAQPRQAVPGADLDQRGCQQLLWPQLAQPGWPWRGETLNVGWLAALWRGDGSAPALVTAATSTGTIDLWLTGRAPDPTTAERLALELWAGWSRVDARWAA